MRGARRRRSAWTCRRRALRVEVAGMAGAVAGGGVGVDAGAWAGAMQLGWAWSRGFLSQEIRPSRVAGLGLGRASPAPRLAREFAAQSFPSPRQRSGSVVVARGVAGDGGACVDGVWHGAWMESSGGGGGDGASGGGGGGMEVGSRRVGEPWFHGGMDGRVAGMGTSWAGLEACVVGGLRFHGLPCVGCVRGMAGSVAWVGMAGGGDGWVGPVMERGQARGGRWRGIASPGRSPGLT